MTIEQVRKMSLEEIKYQYVEYMKSQGLALDTINASKSNAFYILKNMPEVDFWQMMYSDNYVEQSRMYLKSILTQKGSKNIERYLNWQLAHVRRFRRFLTDNFSKSYIEKDKSFNQTEPKKRIYSTVSKSNYLNIPFPSKEQVVFYLNQWEKQENYRLQEKALDKLFFEMAPENKDLSDILIKASALNDFYSTNIFSIYPVAKHIYNLNIDSRLMRGDTELVDDIKKVNMNGKEINQYSFATKYCSHHCPDRYPIFDSYVEKMLKYFRDVYGFADFRNKDLKKYNIFKNVILKFIEYFDLKEFTLKEVDRYLWQAGKKYFNKKYRRR